MTLSQKIINCFQESGERLLEQIACKYNCKVVRENDESLILVGNGYNVRLYLYPGHVPSVNLAIIPTNSEWNAWKKKSPWGSLGLWIDFLVFYYDPNAAIPEKHFKSCDDLAKAISELLRVFYQYGEKLLQGDTAVLTGIAELADRRAFQGEKQSELKALLVLIPR